MKSLEEYIALAGKDGRARSGIVLGIRMILRGLRELGIEEAPRPERTLLAIVETDRCLPDAVELIAGCRLGNRTLKHKNLGKMAVTFVDVETNRAIRLAARESGYREALAKFPDVEKEEALSRAYREFSDEELFTRQWVRVELGPEELPGHRGQRVVCAACGEGVSFGREVNRDGRLLCRTCAGERYFQPLP